MIGKIIDKLSNLLIVGIVAWLLVLQVWPTSYWFEPKYLHINDTIEGTLPEVQYDRVIKRPVTGYYITELERKRRDGTYTTSLCTGGGKGATITYGPDNTLDEVITLDWFTYPAKCLNMLKKGQTYRLQSTWVFSPVGFPDKSVVLFSNDFKVE